MDATGNSAQSKINQTDV